MMNTSSVARRVPSDRFVRISRWLAPASVAACLLVTAGCAQRVYGPPPQAAFAPSTLISEADHRGFHAGVEDGSHDAVTRSGYHPRQDRRYAETPGYNESLGPYDSYRNAFRNAYLRGYADGFRSR